MSEYGTYTTTEKPNNYNLLPSQSENSGSKLEHDLQTPARNNSPDLYLETPKNRTNPLVSPNENIELTKTEEKSQEEIIESLPEIMQPFVKVDEYGFKPIIDHEGFASHLIKMVVETGELKKIEPVINRSTKRPSENGVKRMLNLSDADIRLMTNKSEFTASKLNQLENRYGRPIITGQLLLLSKTGERLFKVNITPNLSTTNTRTEEGRAIPGLMINIDHSEEFSSSLGPGPYLSNEFLKSSLDPMTTLFYDKFKELDTRPKSNREPHEI